MVKYRNMTRIKKTQGDDEYIRLVDSDHNDDCPSSFKYGYLIDSSEIVQLLHSQGYTKSGEWIEEMIALVWSNMYRNMSLETSSIRYIFVHVHPFKGVGFTVNGSSCGSKVVHVSSTYITKLPSSFKLKELKGVTCHELVHVFQYTGMKTAPRGWIEGAADFYRIRIGFAASHWKHVCGDRWDIGYEKTAYFLIWLEERFPDIVHKINMYLKTHRWSDAGGDPFDQFTGQAVQSLFIQYKKNFD
jgi:hypothetical protein